MGTLLNVSLFHHNYLSHSTSASFVSFLANSYVQLFISKKISARAIFFYKESSLVFVIGGFFVLKWNISNLYEIRISVVQIIFGGSKLTACLNGIEKKR
ncbi:hypothetical protein VNO77_22180 [Canavalia gladiata]|uniref:Uncharacterized protein n=1 Tax=Canavalia gladiata TaxID=3824 RepID=A0AAN9QAT1_CANGL